MTCDRLYHDVELITQLTISGLSSVSLLPACNSLHVAYYYYYYYLIISILYHNAVKSWILIGQKVFSIRNGLY